MARNGVTASRAAWTDKEFGDGVRPHMRNLAGALQMLCRYLRPGEAADSDSPTKPLTQKKAAQRFHCCESTLSRYLSGQSMPDQSTVEKVWSAACEDAGGERHVGVSRESLLLLYKEAEAERYRRVDGALAAEASALAGQLKAATAECAVLRQEVTILRTEIRELEAAKAGLQMRLAVRPTPGPLPVPRRRGDRQRMRRDTSAVRALARQAAELAADGQAGAALRLLQRSTEVLNPLETAGVLLLLRQQRHDELADNLIHVYGRDQETSHVLHMALTLHQQGAAKDAGAIMQAALE